MAILIKTTKDTNEYTLSVGFYQKREWKDINLLITGAASYLCLTAGEVIIRLTTYRESFEPIMKELTQRGHNGKISKNMSLCSGIGISIISLNCYQVNLGRPDIRKKEGSRLDLLEPSRGDISPLEYLDERTKVVESS